MSGHLQRLAAPRNYPILRKTAHYVIKTAAGPHTKKMSLPLLLILRDILRIADTQHEIKQILNGRKVLVDGVPRTDMKFPVGLMDVLAFPQVKESYRILLNHDGTLKLSKITDKESKLKLCKILNKTAVRKGKIQLNLHDGRNLIVDDKKYKTSDTILISLPDQKVSKHYPLEKESNVFITDGKHVGEAAKIVDMHRMAGSTEDRVVLENQNGKFETLKRYVFVIGKEQPEVQI
jgi:small subunit ribosomal protein S4e